MLLHSIHMSREPRKVGPASSVDGTKEEFGIRFRNLLNEKGVSVTAAPFYEFFLQKWGVYLRAHPEELREKLLKDWLKKLNDNSQLESYQIHQAIRAVRWAHGGILQEGWVKHVDWLEFEGFLVLREEGSGEVDQLNLQEYQTRLQSKGFKDDSAEILMRAFVALRGRNYAYRTETTYLAWAERFMSHVKSSGMRPSLEQAQLYLEGLALEGNVAPSTQKLALSALTFLFREGLGMDEPKFGTFALAKPKRRIPVVLSRDEVRSLLREMEGTWGLLSELLYGSGLRLMEGIRLRVKDIDFDLGMIVVRQGKGKKDRRTALPKSAEGRLRAHIESIRVLYDEDRRNNVAGVWLPHAAERKAPCWAKEWGWFWVFASSKVVVLIGRAGVASEATSCE